MSNGEAGDRKVGKDAAARWEIAELDVAFRLNILLENGVTSAAAVDTTMACVHMLQRSVEKPPDGEAVAMFATHLAMALQRVIDGIVLDPIEVPAQDLAQLDSGLAVADDIMRDCSATGFALPSYERVLVALHVAAMKSAHPFGSE